MRACARRREPHRHAQQCVARRGAAAGAQRCIGEPHPQLDDGRTLLEHSEQLAILVPFHLKALTARARLLAQSARAERGLASQPVISRVGGAPIPTGERDLDLRLTLPVEDVEDAVLPTRRQDAALRLPGEQHRALGVVRGRQGHELLLRAPGSTPVRSAEVAESLEQAWCEWCIAPWGARLRCQLSEAQRKATAVAAPNGQTCVSWQQQLEIPSRPIGWFASSS